MAAANSMIALHADAPNTASMRQVGAYGGYALFMRCGTTVLNISFKDKATAQRFLYSVISDMPKELRGIQQPKPKATVKKKRAKI